MGVIPDLYNYLIPLIPLIPPKTSFVTRGVITFVFAKTKTISDIYMSCCQNGGIGGISQR